MLMLRSAIPLLLVLALGGCKREPYSRSSSGFSSLDKKVLYDFRAGGPRLQMDLNASAARKILSAVFPAYLSDERQCKAGQSDKSGQIVPTITGAAAGSFTAAGVQQTAYLLDVRECGGKPNSTTKRLAVFDGDKLAANVEAPMGTAFQGTYDLDGDGKNELLLQDAGSGARQRITTARLVEFDKDKLFTVEDLGQVYDDDCLPGDDEKSLSASVVYYLPPPAGQKPRFTVELYRAPCPAQGQPPQWTRVNAR